MIKKILNLESRINSHPHNCTGDGESCSDSYDSISSKDTFSQTVVNRGRACSEAWRAKQRHFTAMTT